MSWTANWRSSSTAWLPTTKPSASSRSLPRHNPPKEVPHGDSSGFRSWLRFDEKLERSLGIRPRRHSFISAPLLGLVWQFHGVGSCCPSLGATPCHALIQFSFL